MVERVCNHATVSKAKEENAKMGFAKRLKFWKRAENHKTGVIRGKVCLERAEENAKMGFAKRLKFWKRAENHKTGVIRGKVCFSPLGLLRIM